MLDILTIGDIKLDTFVVLNDASLQCQLVKSPTPPIPPSADGGTNPPSGRGGIDDCKLCLDYGAKIEVKTVDSQIAGSAPNVAVGLSRQGRRAAIASVMGRDATRPLALEFLKREGVATRHIETVKDEVSAFSVVINFKGEKTMLTSHTRHHYHLPNPLPKTDWLYVSEMGSGYEDMYRDVIAAKKKNGFNVGLNPGSVQVKEAHKALFDLIRVCDLLIVNKTEAQKITGKTTQDPHHLCAALDDLGAGAVVVTDGRNGSWGMNGQGCWHCPIYPGKFVEATGAGDSFSSGVLGALMAGGDLAEGLRWGSVNAASVVAYVGPTRGLLSVAQIKTRLHSRPSFKSRKL